jgi:hypothetical protein
LRKVQACTKRRAGDEMSRWQQNAVALVHDTVAKYTMCKEYTVSSRIDAIEGASRFLMAITTDVASDAVNVS